ncbi:MAG: hypothetical protein JWO55_370 [Candidatus Saccharibacteria bacterium]|nr:hypothetical protein [Candidatus Saccharibacteria bacterium]
MKPPLYYDVGFKIEFSEYTHLPKRAIIMARVSKEHKENLKQLYLDIKDTMGRKRPLKMYGQKPIMLEVVVSETVPSEKIKWLGKLARFWDSRKTIVENRRVLALLRSENDLIALLMDGSILTARKQYRPFRRVDFNTLTSEEYRHLMRHGLAWQEEISGK